MRHHGGERLCLFGECIVVFAHAVLYWHANHVQHMDSDEDAARAIQMLSKRDFMGRRINVEMATAAARGNRGGG